MKKNLLYLPAFLLILAFSTVIQSCTDPLAPVPPTWNVDINLPLSNSERTLEQLLGNDTSVYVREGDGSVVVVGKTFPLDNIHVGNSLQLENTSYAFTRMLGELTFDIPDILNKDVTVPTLFPALPDGTYPVTPQTNSSAIDVYVSAQQFFQEATFEKGKVYFELFNTLPVPLTFPQPAELHDAGGNLIGSVLITDALAPNAKMTLQPIILDGMTLSNSMNLAVYVATPGSDGLPVTIVSTQALNIRASITDTKIRSAVGAFPAQTIEYAERLNVSQLSGTQIQTAHIISGSVRISLQNHIAVSSDVDVVIDGMTKNDVPLHTTMTVDARGMQSVTLDVSDYTFTPVNMAYLPLSVVVRTADSKDTFVKITSTDSVAATASLVDVVFDRVTGSIAPKLVSLQTSKNIDLRLSEKFNGAISYNDVKMWVTITNNSALPLDLEGGRFTCFNDQTSQSATVDVPMVRIQPFGKTDVYFENGQVAELFKSFGATYPNRVDIDAQATLNKDNVFGTLSEGDFLTGELHVEIPMKFGIESAQYTDRTEINLDPKVIEDLKDVESGQLHIEIENHLPTGFTFELAFVDGSLVPLLTPKNSTGEPFHVASGVLDGGGIVTESSQTSFIVNLTKEEVAQFAQCKFMTYVVKLDQSLGAPVVFRMEDFIKIKTYATFSANSNLIVSN
jgi:hypothetical protein